MKHNWTPFCYLMRMLRRFAAPNRWLVLTITILILAEPARAATFSYIERIGLKEGLSNSSVRCLFQDHQGFLWFGTYDGLNRYDGYDFRVYRNHPDDTASIIHSYVNCIAEDVRNNLWVGTRQGISVLNTITEKFSPAYFIQPGSGRSQLTSYIRDIRTDASGRIYAATQTSGLVIFDGPNSTGRIIPCKVGGLHSEWNYNVSALYIGRDHKIYLLIADVGLCIFNNNQIELLDSTIKRGICIYTEGNNLWLGNNDGLHHFNLAQHHYDKHFNEAGGQLRSTRITSLQPMPDGTLWVGTDGGGIHILDKNRTGINYLTAGNDEHSLSSNAVYTLLLDRDGRKWIGTLRGGINIIDDVKDRFQNLRHDPLNSNSLISNFIKSVYEDGSGKLWIGTDGGGLSIWERNAHRFTNFSHDVRNSGSLSSNFVTSIAGDNSGNTWIATYGGGIDLYLPSGAFKTYYGIDGSGQRTRVIFWLLYLDRAGNLWASGLQDGLFLYDRSADAFKLYDARIANVLALREDKSGNLWAGNFEGLYQINPRNKSYRFYATGKPVRSIHQADNGNVWLGTEAGLMYFDAKQQKVIETYTTNNGLSNNNILAIEEDGQQRLWLSTYNGLCRLEPKSHTFTNFSQSDGLASKEFNFNASLKLKNGQLAFGGINGLSLFYPEDILPLRNSPNITLTDIKIDNKPLNANPGYFKSDDNNHIRSLSVPYNRATLSFGFAAIEFTAQERISYRYQLQGWDRGWVYAGQQRNALYTRLNPGSYLLRVNCTNPEGQWSSKEVQLSITILPPWYRTVWAYLIYLGIIGGIIYGYLHYRFRETRLKYEIKLANASAEHQRSLQAKERELNERRTEFFTGISHEFRTPLSLIINPIRDLLQRSAAADRQELNIIYRNSRRLLSLVDQLLLFRKADAGLDALQIARMDINLVCHEVYLCFVQQAKLSGIKYNLQVPHEPVTIYGDREKIEIILFNLISNAIKYTPAGQTVTVNLKGNHNDVYIEVTDGGPGIPKEAGEQIFEKFYRSKSTGNPLKAGFGIGLYLAQQFTRDHHGRLTYESAPGNGTIFKLTLLKGTAHFPGYVINDDVPETGSPLLDELTEDKLSTPHTDEDTDTVIELEKIFTDKKRILIIDDDHEIRSYIRSVLESKYIIFEAADGIEGLQKARQKQPDMIICDVMMPGLNGIELCATIKQDTQLSYIPMILLTASSSREAKIKGLESGADDYISKPFEKDVLVARIANLLQIRSNLQNYFYDTITLKTGSINISDEYKLFLEKCIEIVERHITDEHFNIKVLASEIGMSHSNLYRKVKSLSGHTVNSFIRFIRLRKAAELLIQSDMNVNEVAIATGFNSIKYFRNQFFKLFGANPSDFVKQKRPVFKKKFNVIN